jgi:putative oxidoreductase
MNLAALRSHLLATLDRVRWVGPLALRLSLGAVFVASGWGKLHNLEQVTKFFGELGIPFPGFNAALASTTELVGGALIAFGLLTRLATVPLMVTMAVAILTARRPDIEGVISLFGFIEVTYLAGFLWLLVAGPGKVSLDALLFGRKAPLPQPILRPSTPTA